MTLIALIADDLTGANDSGVQFVRHGFGAAVFFAGRPVSEGAEVLVVDTDSRGLSAEEAYVATRRAAEGLLATHPALVYKKVDSTLRGNLAAEIGAVLDAFELPMAVVAPAFPRIGRTTEGGLQYLHGVPVHETEVGRDPKAPAMTADIPALLSHGSGLQAGLITLAEVRSGQVLARLKEHRDQGVRLVVCDAITEADLVSVATGGGALDEPLLWVGSAGLADVLPQALGLRAGASQRTVVDGAQAPVLLVVGSVSSVSRNQLASVLAQPGVGGVELRTEAILSGGAEAEAEEARCIEVGIAALRAGQDLALFSAVSDDAVARTQALGRSRGLSPVESSEWVATALGRIAGQLCRKAEVGGLVLTGGDTAQAVCRAIGATGIDLSREVEPGIPLGRLVGEHPYAAVTKAGAFGSEQALWLAVQSLKEGGRS